MLAFQTQTIERQRKFLLLLLNIKLLEKEMYVVHYFTEVFKFIHFMFPLETFKLYRHFIGEKKTKFKLKKKNPNKLFVDSSLDYLIEWLLLNLILIFYIQLNGAFVYFGRFDCVDPQAIMPILWFYYDKLYKKLR